MTKQLLIESSEYAFVAEEGSLAEATKTTTVNGLLLVKDVIATKLGEKNSNGRVYTKSMMEKSISECQKKGYFENKSLLCAGDDHPKTTHVSPINASHVVTKAYVKMHEDRPHLMNHWLILPTTNGKNLRALVDSGVAIGTSIRGLGKVNESTSEVEDYNYLGTDAVGSPSAGTYATPTVYKVHTESLDLELNLESLPTLKENEMFDIEKAVTSFKSKYYKEGQVPNLSESKDVGTIVSEIVKMEVAALQEGVKLSDNFVEMKEAVLGQLGTSEKTPEDNPANKTKMVAEANDLVTKLERKLGAEQAVSSFLVKNNADMVESINSMKNTMASYNEVLEGVKTELKDLFDNKDEDHMVLNKESQAQLAQEIKDHLIEIVTEIQEEAKESILNLEESLNTATAAADVITEQMFASQWLANALAQQVKRLTESSTKKVMTYSRTLESARRSR